MSRLPSIALAAAFTVACATSSAGTPQAAQSRASAPSLIIVLTIDQLRPDYIDRFGPQLTGGLAWLFRTGAVFRNAYQDHAITETAPGHASILSGRFPRSTGIVANIAGVGDPSSPLIGSTDLGASPFRFRGTTLTDWIAAKEPSMQAFSVSRKDRGAILTIGRSRRPVYWFAWNGIFTTSKYYADTLPTWVREFNRTSGLSAYAGTSWTTLLPASSYPEPDSVATESQGTDYVFPHRLPDDVAQVPPAFLLTPSMDSLTLAFALRGTRQLRLGAGRTTDVLAISLSSTDAVGHRFGPDSRELHDQILRVDRYLGDFFRSLFAMRDSTRVVIALTADHGVTPLPKTASRDPNQGADWVNLRPVIVNARAGLRAADVDTTALVLEENMLYVRDSLLGTLRPKRDSIVAAFRDAALKVNGVLRVDAVRDLPSRDSTDVIARRWLHMLPPDLPVALVVTNKPFWYVAGLPAIATHGTPHDLDAHVPLVFRGPSIRAGKYDTFVRTVDIGPTLARLAGVVPTEPVDGRDLSPLIRP